PIPPEPDSSTHSRPSCQRGECGIDRPALILAPEGTSSTTPPFRLLARQPLRVSLVPRAVTNRGTSRPCSSGASAKPLRWQRSSGASAVTKGGRQRGWKLCWVLRVHRQEKRVLTNHSSSSAQAISCIWISPVHTDERGRKQASCTPAEGKRRATAG